MPQLPCTEEVKDLMQSLCLACAGFRVLEMGAGTGGLTKDALEMFEMDMHRELLRYCATDITSAFSTGLLDAVRSPKLTFKVSHHS
jgi:fatty acid synthase